VVVSGNHVCIFNTFYRSWIHRGWTTTLVSLIQPRLNVFFLLVTILFMILLYLIKTNGKKGYFLSFTIF